MITLQERPTVGTPALEHPAVLPTIPPADLRVDRSDISFEDIGQNRVLVRIRVRNQGGQRSRPTVLKIHSAPLGAFVPWRPLTEASVPALDPGESLEVTTKVARPRPVPLGDFDRVPPRKVLTALNLAGPSASPQQGTLRMLWIMQKLKLGAGRSVVAEALTRRTSEPELPPDLLELLGRSNPHWAGNLNVFIGAKPVERHMAKALRVYPARTNLAFFVVGDNSRPDAYRFKLTGLETAWKTVLYDTTHDDNLLVGESSFSIDEGHWVETDHSLLVVLATCPPKNCRAGNLGVQVTQQSTGRSTVVEFTLNPNADGPGCYAV